MLQKQQEAFLSSGLSFPPFRRRVIADPAGFVEFVFLPGFNWISQFHQTPSGLFLPFISPCKCANVGNVGVASIALVHTRPFHYSPY